MDSAARGQEAMSRFSPTLSVTNSDASSSHILGSGDVVCAHRSSSPLARLLRSGPFACSLYSAAACRGASFGMFARGI